ncbi:hypothetical protein GQ600_6054 [Phytophthora cactorum]|nr:hypothetical protein GQ600_6054 [Phytophthora cactorum]
MPNTNMLIFELPSTSNPSPTMKISVSILTTTVLLVVAARGVPGALADQSIVASDIDTSFNTTQPSNDEKASWAPIRAL